MELWAQWFHALPGYEKNPPGLPVYQQIDGASIAHERNREVCDATEGRLNVEGTEQPCRVRQEHSMLQKPLAFGYVAEAPDSSDDLLPDSLRPGVAFEHATVFETLDIEALSFRIPVQLARAVQELIGIFELIANVCQQLFVIVLLSKILFGGFHAPWAGRRRWREQMQERWVQMTPEERERFREGMRGRCGWTRDPRSVPEQKTV